MLAFTPWLDERDSMANQHIELISNTQDAYGEALKSAGADYR